MSTETDSQSQLSIRLKKLNKTAVVLFERKKRKMDARNTVMKKCEQSLKKKERKTSAKDAFLYNDENNVIFYIVLFSAESFSLSVCSAQNKRIRNFTT